MPQPTFPAEWPEAGATGLVPVPVWAHFATLCRIPRPSGHEGALRDHLLQWAVTQGLEAQVDAAGNLLVRKPASAGREGAPGVVLQGHLDMVCQKNSDHPHDFFRDPIQPVLRQGRLIAQDTTLGADNGIGVALMLAVLEDRSLQHGPIEALFTVDEEAGMGGAHGLSADTLKGRLMLNLDTEAWGEFYLGCAGGLDVVVDRMGQPAPWPGQHDPLVITLGGLRGGHSGVDIHEERGNAIKLLVRVLADLHASWPLCLAEIKGGTARNALPREATALVGCLSSHRPALAERLAHWQTLLRQELAGVDEGLTLVVQAAQVAPANVLSAADQSAWLHSLHAAPHGVHRMSRRVPGVVETSCNLGIVDLTAHTGRAHFMVRSLLDSGSRALADQIVSLFTLAGSTAVCGGHYPGWAPNPQSPLLKLCQGVYAREYGQPSVVKVIHAGLECGIIAARYPDMDIVSFGPTIEGAHAPGESVDIASVDRCWHLLTAILAEIQP